MAALERSASSVDPSEEEGSHVAGLAADRQQKTLAHAVVEAAEVEWSLGDLQTPIADEDDRREDRAGSEPQSVCAQVAQPIEWERF